MGAVGSQWLTLEDGELLDWFKQADPLGEEVVVTAGERNIARRRGLAKRD